MLSHHDLGKSVTVTFGNGVSAIKGTLTDYDDANGRWIEVQGVIVGIDRGSGLATRHVIPASGVAYVRFDKEEEKP